MGLEEEMVRFHPWYILMNLQFNRKTNSATPVSQLRPSDEDISAAARLVKRNLWRESLEKVFDLLPFPGQLSTQPFDCLLQDKTFARRICALDIDELQLEVIRHSERPFDTSLILSHMPRRT